MESGVLWSVEKGEGALDRAVMRAAARVVARLRVVPNTAMVHPALLPDGDRDVRVTCGDGEATVRLRANPWVGMGYVWVGRESSFSSRGEVLPASPSRGGGDAGEMPVVQQLGLFGGGQ